MEKWTVDTPTAELRFVRGRLQQKWIVKHYSDSTKHDQLDKGYALFSEQVWREVPSADE